MWKVAEAVPRRARPAMRDEMVSFIVTSSWGRVPHEVMGWCPREGVEGAVRIIHGAG